MSITSVQKTSLLVVILIIVGAGAFVYFDPLDLDLLSLKQKPAAAKPAIPHVASSQAVTPPHPMEAPVAAPSPAHIAVPAAQPPIASLNPAVTPTQTKTTAQQLQQLLFLKQLSRRLKRRFLLPQHQMLHLSHPHLFWQLHRLRRNH